jgi:anaerobic selenocysteine-containing dehydrogenase
MKRVIHAACPHDCPDACGVLITVEDGVATRVQGDPAHPVTRGFLCGKVAKYLDRVYSPDRVLYPLRRTAQKGSGHRDFRDFARITWDEALDEIATRFRGIIAAHGAQAILPYSYGGTLAVLNGGSMDRRFFHRLGASLLARTICSEAGEQGLKSVVGVKLGTEPEQFRYARLIIAWAANIHGNNVHLWPFIEEARRNGAKFIVIDPYRTRTAAGADWHLPVNPGTDVALALGLMHVIIGERLYDAEYVARHTFGFEELSRKVREYPPEQVALWTGISAGDIRKLAREYATTRPAVIRLNYGIQRCENGGMATRAVAMLPCLTGSWKDIGGGLQLSTSGAYGLNRAALERQDLAPAGTRTINMVQLGRELNTRRDPPIKALFVYNSNPAAVCPHHNEVVRGLSRPDLFTVVHEQFLTDTCDYADIVLPATTFFEHKDLQTAYGHYYLQLSEAALAPPGECRSNVETFRALAQKMGFDDPCFGESADEMIDLALTSSNQWLQGITRERLQREGHVRLNFGGRIPDAGLETANSDSTQVSGEVPSANAKAQVSNGFFQPFAEGGFPTASGKAEFYSASLAAQGLDPVVAFTPPAESRHAAAPGAKYPLELLARKPEDFLNSTFTNLPGHQQMESHARRISGLNSVADLDILEMNAADAEARGIREGDLVRVFNNRGEVRLRARVSRPAAVQPGLVAARLNWDKLSPGGQINVLTSDRLSDLGGGPTFYSVLVEVEKS